jgi:hypothetical protein
MTGDVEGDMHAEYLNTLLRFLVESLIHASSMPHHAKHSRIRTNGVGEM